MWKIRMLVTAYIIEKGRSNISDPTSIIVIVFYNKLFAYSDGVVPVNSLNT